MSEAHGWRKYLAPKELAWLVGEFLAWVWFVFAGCGGLRLIITEGPLPLTRLRDASALPEHEVPPALVQQHGLVTVVRPATEQHPVQPRVLALTQEPQPVLQRNR